MTLKNQKMESWKPLWKRKSPIEQSAGSFNIHTILVRNNPWCAFFFFFSFLELPKVAIRSEIWSYLRTKGEVVRKGIVAVFEYKSLPMSFLWDPPMSPLLIWIGRLPLFLSSVNHAHTKLDQKPQFLSSTPCFHQPHQLTNWIEISEGVLSRIFLLNIILYTTSTRHENKSGVMSEPHVKESSDCTGNGCLYKEWWQMVIEIMIMIYGCWLGPVTLRSHHKSVGNYNPAPFDSDFYKINTIWFFKNTRQMLKPNVSFHSNVSNLGIGLCYLNFFLI